jgi:phage terminase large subunit-like protein
MNKDPEGTRRLELVQSGSIGLTSGIEATPETLYGSPTPRLHSRLRDDLPTLGQELIDFSNSIGKPLLPWQEWLAIQAHRTKPDGRWLHPLIAVVVARQNGKTTIMKQRILMGLFEWKNPLQIGTAHRLTTSLETFRDLVDTIESNDGLAKQVKRIRWAHGSEEIETLHGTRYMVKAGASAARGISKPETVHIDETRELKDESTWASMRYTMMAAENPQLWTYSNQGDQHSLILNQLRERGLAAMAGANDDIGFFEWSSHYEKLDDSEEFWKGIAKSNPALGHTIHRDNIRAVLNDPLDVVKTEVLCVPVATMSAAIPAHEWSECGSPDLDLDPEKITYLGLDCSPDRRSAALVAGQTLDGENFFVKLLHTWHNPVSLDDKAIANDVANYCREWPVEVVAYSKRTSSAVAARLVPAGIPIADIDGNLYGQACDELLGAITSKRLRHKNQPELTKQVLSAAKLPFGDGGWTIGRKASQSTVCATVASALVTHYATRPETDLDIMIG